MKVNVLKVFNGDCIHISYKLEGKPINIVIDSGSRKAYEDKELTAPYNKIDGKFKKLIHQLNESNRIIFLEKLRKLKWNINAKPLTLKKFQHQYHEFQKEYIINLLIITHVDDDHIGGVLEWMKSKEFDSSMIGKIWFNSGQLINEYFNKNFENNNKINLNSNISSSEEPTAISHGVSFEEKIKEYKIWDRKIIKIGRYKEIDIGAEFLILSPSEKELEKLLTKWEKEAISSITTSTPREYKKTLTRLLEDDKDNFSDRKAHNGSSIAFVLEIKNRKLLFLADCFHQTIITSMQTFGINSLDVDLVKISHHGSKYNTNNELLEKINSDKYLISTDGSRHKHPNKITFARIINKNPNCKIYLNYKEKLKEKIFLSQDYENHAFSIHSTDDLEI